MNEQKDNNGFQVNVKTQIFYVTVETDVRKDRMDRKD